METPPNKGPGYWSEVFHQSKEDFEAIEIAKEAVYHAVSKKHLPRYLSEFDFRWNTRKMNDGERTDAVIQNAVGKRLDYATLRA